MVRFCRHVDLRDDDHGYGYGYTRGWLELEIYLVRSIGAIVWYMKLIGDRMYSAWIIATAIFVFLNMEWNKTFVIHSFLYLASSGTVIWFFCAVLKINPDTIPLYIPLCTDLGLLLGIGIDHLWSSWQASAGKWVAILQSSIVHVWSAEGRIEGELPLLPVRSTDPAQPPPLSHDDDEHPPEPPPLPRHDDDNESAVE